MELSHEIELLATMGLLLKLHSHGNRPNNVKISVILHIKVHFSITFILVIDKLHDYVLLLISSDN